ncbi:MAG: amidase [Gammaproteobacteria bacterium CG11_big_fil_rev_8_21_14_0_20_46_22]|nr:MAG: amidase [Gammaproteobacteria bacterium CG12_big_fil_rev_8_21_14_0_65_46_12]PIR11719.1 MAG: amidase [Gammaproteobacteria bacterium CG11_big_fil_rev_8_21_14_0_20_46_22]
MKFEDYRQYDALGLAELVKTKAVTPAELIDCAIARCEAINPKINAVVATDFDRAREHHCDLNAPFAGVPFLMKDSDAYQAGLPATFGSRLCEKFIPQKDSGLVTRFKQAGVTIFGRTNSCEFGLKYMTEPELHGPTNNPWDVSRTPGGSSGGSAAAVASGITPMAHANDGGGSIRVPASCTGLFGLKPARARISIGPEQGELWNGLACDFILSRSVRDAAAMLDCMAGYQVGDPYCAPPAPSSFLAALNESLPRLRICVSFDTGVPGLKPDEDAVAAVNQAAELCQNLGHEVRFEAPAFDRQAIESAAAVIICVNAKAAITSLAKLIACAHPLEKIEASTRYMVERGEQYCAADFCLALQTLHNESRKVVAEFERFDVLLTPVTTSAAVKTGALKEKEKDLESLWAAQVGFAPYTSLFNFTGQPAMSVPLYWNTAGLPLGVQFVGPYSGELRLMQLAKQLEEAAPWFYRVPSI